MMSNFIKADQFEGGYVAIEVTDVAGAGTEVSPNRMKVEEFDNCIEDTKIIAEKALRTFTSLDIEEVELEFGIKAGVELGVAFWFITKAATEANFNVKMKWKRKKTSDEK